MSWPFPIVSVDWWGDLHLPLCPHPRSGGSWPPPVRVANLAVLSGCYKHKKTREGNGLRHDMSSCTRRLETASLKKQGKIHQRAFIML